MKKRLLSALLCVAMVASLVVGCGGKEEPAAAETPAATEETTDDDEFNIDPEIAVIIPLYMASQLYKDDDISIATVYRNEFEVALENYYSEINDLKFVSKSGWL